MRVHKDTQPESTSSGNKQAADLHKVGDLFFGLPVHQLVEVLCKLPCAREGSARLVKRKADKWGRKGAGADAARHEQDMAHNGQRCLP